jgi:hypothetical protein
MDGKIVPRFSWPGRLLALSEYVIAQIPDGAALAVLDSLMAENGA